MKGPVGGILAGGYGKRLIPYTLEIPKSLLELKNGYTILDKQLFDLKNAGIKSVYLMVGYLHDKIVKRYGKDYLGMKIEYLIEDKPMGTLWAIRNALEYVSGDILVMNGDIVCDISLKNFIKYAQNSDNLITIAVSRMRSPYGIVIFGDNRKVISFKEKPLLEYYINAGIYYIKRGAIDYFNRKYYEKDVERSVFPDIAADGFMGVYFEENVYWQSVDSIKDLEAVREFYRGREDKPWGYEKLIVKSKNLKVVEIYIRKDEETEPYSDVEETLLTLSGKGILKIIKDGSEKMIYLKEQNTVTIDKESTRSIYAIENLKIHSYEIA